MVLLYGISLWLIALALSCSAERRIRTNGDAIELSAVRVTFLKDTTIKRGIADPEHGQIYMPRLFFLYEDDDHLVYRLPVYVGKFTTIFKY
jgi:hypothetical protein